MFFKSNLEDMEEILCDYETEWEIDRSTILKTFSNTQGDSDNNREKLETSSSLNFSPEISYSESVDSKEPAEEVDKLDPREDAPAWAKDLYKKIARKTHPDILGDNAADSPLANIFKKAASIMKDEDYGALIDICVDLNIPIETDDLHISRILSDRIKSIKSKILKIEESVPWVWGESFGILEIRSKIILALLENYGVDSPDKDRIKEIIETIEN